MAIMYSDIVIDGNRNYLSFVIRPCPFMDWFPRLPSQGGCRVKRGTSAGFQLNGRWIVLALHYVFPLFLQFKDLGVHVFLLRSGSGGKECWSRENEGNNDGLPHACSQLHFPVLKSIVSTKSENQSLRPDGLVWLGIGTNLTCFIIPGQCELAHRSDYRI